VDHGREPPFDVVFERQLAVGLARNPPIDQVHIKPGVQILPDDALFRLQVEDVGTIDQGIAKQERWKAARGRCALIVAQAERADLQHDLVRGRTDRGIDGRSEQLRPAQEPAPGSLLALEQRGLLLRQLRHRPLDERSERGTHAGALHIAMPPLMSSTCPVTNPAAGEARYSTLAATSIGSPRRPTGVLSRTLFRILSGRPSSMRVLMKPGAMALTVTPLLAYSRASVLVSPIRPALAAA